MIRWLTIGLLSLAASVAQGQVFVVSAGSSTISGGSGVMATMYRPDATDSASMSVYDGKVILGAADHRVIRGWDVTTGDTQFGVSGGTFGVSTQLLGVLVRRESLDHHRKYGGFVGATGNFYQTPFSFGTGMPSNAGAGAFFEQVFGRFTFDSVAVLVRQPRIVNGIAGRNESVLTILQAIKYDRRWLVVNVDAGELQNQFVWTGQAQFQAKHVAASVTEQTLLLGGTRASFEDESVSYSQQHWGVNVGAVQSHAIFSTSGEFATGNLNFLSGRLTFRSEYFRSGNTPASWTNSASERFKRKFYISESLTRSRSQQTVDFGGGYAGNILSVDVGHSELYYPLLANPWQRTLSISIGLRLPHQSQVSASTLATPNGGLKWGISGSKYEYRDVDPAMQEHARTGKVVVAGRVCDPHGLPVDGAALRIGNEFVYSDSEGMFSVRFGKNKAYPVAVIVDEFLSGKWKIVTAPATAVPNQTLSVTVERIP